MTPKAREFPVVTKTGEIKKMFPDNKDPAING